jgi:L-methionine (R)-S-oxide reductase
MDDTFIEDLVGVGALFEREQSLEDGLRDLARLTARSVGAGRCSVMLLSDSGEGETPTLKVYSHFGDLPAQAYRAPVKPGESIAWHVVETQTSLLLDDIEHSDVSALARQGADAGHSMMSAPIRLSGRVIGVINTSLPTNAERFERPDLDLLEVFALFVGQSIQVFQLQRLSESRVLQMAHLLEQREGGAQKPISPDPARIAKIVAKTFYRELRQAGFGTNAIISVATEVLGLLETNLEKYRTRLDDDREPQ